MRPNVVVYDTLEEAMGKAGKPRLARSLYEEMMVSDGLSPNEKTDCFNQDLWQYKVEQGRIGALGKDKGEQVANGFHSIQHIVEYVRGSWGS